jgi:hypothetical protein
VEQREAPAVHGGRAGDAGTRGRREIPAELGPRTTHAGEEKDASQDRVLPRCARGSRPCGGCRVPPELGSSSSISEAPRWFDSSRAAWGPRRLQWNFSWLVRFR